MILELKTTYGKTMPEVQTVAYSFISDNENTNCFCQTVNLPENSTESWGKSEIMKNKEKQGGIQMSQKQENTF